jgi:hypothetical protein
MKRPSPGQLPKIGLIIAASLLLLALSLLPRSASADLPDRPTPPSKKEEKSGRNVGAHIALHADGLTGWSVVQWQDSDGNWQTVEGWQGNLEAGRAVWWVHPKDFNTGPFRWVVLTEANGTVIATSDPFMLPREHYQYQSVFVAANGQ